MTSISQIRHPNHEATVQQATYCSMITNRASRYKPLDASALLSSLQLHQQRGQEPRPTTPCNEELLDRSPKHIM